LIDLTAAIPLLVHGEIALSANTTEELRQSDVVRRLYLGVA
jgi:hypothetical protein